MVMMWDGTSYSRSSRSISTVTNREPFQLLKLLSGEQLRPIACAQLFIRQANAERVLFDKEKPSNLRIGSNVNIMSRTSSSSIFFLICSFLSTFCNGFSYRSSPIQQCTSFKASPSKYRSLQVPHLQPKVQEENRYVSTLQSAPLENINELEEENPNPLNLKVIIPVVTVLAVAAVVLGSGKFGTFDFTQIIEESASKIEKMGPYGYLYFALVRGNLPTLQL